MEFYDPAAHRRLLESKCHRIRENRTALQTEAAPRAIRIIAFTPHEKLRVGDAKTRDEGNSKYK
jgi:hypothetical protein